MIQSALRHTPGLSWCREEREQLLSTAEICHMVISDPVILKRGALLKWVNHESDQAVRQWHYLKYIRITSDSFIYICILKKKKNVSSCFSAENTRGANLRCLTRNEWVKGERNNEEMWCQRRGVLQTQWGTELLTEGDWIRYRLPCCSMVLVSQQPGPHTASFHMRQSAKTPRQCLWLYSLTSIRLWLLDVHEVAVIKHI